MRKNTRIVCAGFVAYLIVHEEWIVKSLWKYWLEYQKMKKQYEEMIKKTC